jgi:hypothetical protein
MKESDGESQKTIRGTYQRPTRVPNTPAGQRCFDVLWSLAKKMLDKGNEATGNFIQSNYPEAKTIGKDYADRKFMRTIEWGGEQITVIYDYKTQTTMVEQKCKESE